MDFAKFAQEILALPVTEVFPELKPEKEKKWNGILGTIKDKFKK
jgi:hypothetical protein